MSENNYIRSPFFYVGDKFKLIPQLKENFPKDIDRFIEPFCGGGSVFLNTNAKKYLLNDIDSYVIKLHQYLISNSSNPDLFWDKLKCNIERYNLSKNVIIQFEKAKAYQISLQELYEDKQSILFNRSSFPKDINKLCNYVRDLISFPISSQKGRKDAKVVFEIFRERFYELGIYVFKDSFKDNNISGLCLNDSQYPIIIINNSMSFARQNFTLFHELYHLLTNTSGAEIIRDDFYVYLNEQQTKNEKNCDKFANAFLIPVDDFEIELSKSPLNEDRITELAILYSVSKEAIMYKLLTMGKISNVEYDNLKETFYGDALRNIKHQSKGNGGGNYYYTKLSYLGQRYTGDVFKEYFSGRIDNVRASEMLNSKIDHLPKLESAYFRGLK